MILAPEVQHLGEAAFCPSWELPPHLAARVEHGPQFRAPIGDGLKARIWAVRGFRFRPERTITGHGDRTRTRDTFESGSLFASDDGHHQHGRRRPPNRGLRCRESLGLDQIRVAPPPPATCSPRPQVIPAPASSVDGQRQKSMPAWLTRPWPPRTGTQGEIVTKMPSGGGSFLFLLDAALE